MGVFQWPGAQRLRVEMRKAGLSQSELSRRTGIGQSSVSRYASGDRAPKSAHVAVLLRELPGLGE